MLEYIDNMSDVVVVGFFVTVIVAGVSFKVIKQFKSEGRNEKN